MAKTKPTLLRLRETTVDKLKLAVAQSAHRSMASLADEILDKELTRQLELYDDAVEQMIKAMQRGQQP